MMITVICSTDRPASNSMRVARACAAQLEQKGEQVQILDLQELNPQWVRASSFGPNSPEMEAVVKRYIRAVERMVLVVPEYNGSFPGIVKYFIDGCDHGDWARKRIALIGLATGRGGNLRGLDHLTGIFHYLGSEVFGKKVYISRISGVLDTNGELTDAMALAELNAQMDGFLNF